MNKPGAAWRERPYWHWGWPYAAEERPVQGSGIQRLAEYEAERPAVAAKLVVPEAQSATGWRDYWVYREPAAPEPQRPLGFQ